MCSNSQFNNFRPIRRRSIRCSVSHFSMTQCSMSLCNFTIFEINRRLFPFHSHSYRSRSSIQQMCAVKMHNNRRRTSASHAISLQHTAVTHSTSFSNQFSDQNVPAEIASLSLFPFNLRTNCSIQQIEIRLHTKTEEFSNLFVPLNTFSAHQLNACASSSFFSFRCSQHRTMDNEIRVRRRISFSRIQTI